MNRERLSLPAADRKSASEKLALAALWILVTYAIIRSLFAAASKPFWYDEVSTVIVARQPSISAIWKALARPADGQPPPFFLVERAAAALLHNPQIGFRLPAICGFVCTLVCVFFFVKRRSGAPYALLCTSTLLLTVAYSTYAIEARPYSLLVACIALALLCYQQAPDWLWLVLMGFSLAGAEASHYYAIFALVPLGLAEIALSLKTRRLRPGVWLALACGLLPLVVFWPLLRGQKIYWGRHIWNQPSLRHVGGTYAWLLGIPARDHLHIEIAAVSMLVLVGILAAFAVPGVRRASMASPFFHEHVLVWGLLGLPLVAYVATKIAHGGFDHKYVLESVLVVPLGSAYILPRLNRKVVVLLAVLSVSVLLVQETRFWISQRGHIGEIRSPAVPVEALANLAGHSDLPVVVSDTLDYLSFVYYASPRLAKRLVAVGTSRRKSHTRERMVLIGASLRCSLFIHFKCMSFRLSLLTTPASCCTRMAPPTTGGPADSQRTASRWKWLLQTKTEKIYLVRTPH